jgi:Fe-S oxidoreductase
MEPVRPLFYNIHDHYPWAEAGTYVAAVVVIGLFAHGVWRHVRNWRLGGPEPVTGGWVARLPAFVRFGLLQGRLASDRYALGMHLAIFLGMAVLFLGTVLATVDQDITYLLFDFQFLRGLVYLAYKLFLDVFAVVLIAGLALALIRRYALKPARLRHAAAPTFPLDSFYLLAMLGGIAVTGLFVEALRLAATPVPWAKWSPVGSALSGLFAGATPGRLQTAHFAAWLLHALMALTFIALIPYSKAFHLISSAISIYLRNLGPVGALPVANPAGVARFGDFTWRQLLEFDACTWCGRCHEQCPAAASGAPLSPRDLVLKLGAALWRGNHHAARAAPAGNTPPAAPPPANGDSLHATVISSAELWACSTCRACEEVCPVFIEQPRAIVDLRRHLIGQGRLDPTLQETLTRLDRYGNTFGKSDRLRGRWAAGAQPRIKDARKEPVDAVWFLGDYAGYDSRAQESAQAAAQVLQWAGVDFGLLFEGERNSGNDVRRAGEEGLFEVLREKNLETLARVKWKNGQRIVFTTDPHSYNTLRHEYPLAGQGWQVKHHTELLDELLQQGRLVVRRKLSARVTYHDPCYLGRYNGVYDPPRRVLAAIGASVVELPRNRDRSFCCGAGGGRIWMEDAPQQQERPAALRVREAAALGEVPTLVVACPKDLAMFRDAAKTTGQEGNIVIKDIAELVRDAAAQ